MFAVVPVINADVRTSHDNVQHKNNACIHSVYGNIHGGVQHSVCNQGKQQQQALFTHIFRNHNIGDMCVNGIFINKQNA